jgi:hypothetical protein
LDAAAQVFDEILDALMCGKIVPFVGAGISANARVPGCDSFEPTIRQMKTRVENATQRQANPTSPECPPATEAATFDRVVEKYRWQVANMREVCEALAIPCFAKLEPQPAHYAIASLAREGLIDEVISTNWDACIEKAVNCLSGKLSAHCEVESPARSISDLKGYRQHGSTRRSLSGEAILRLYKINGCAKRYAAQRDQASAEAIIVTERQLQDFKQRSWARDLLKDRARSRTLVFSGFGSDEPQVRRAVLQLMDEFSEDGTACGDEHNLFVTAFEATLSFCQEQILRSFCESQGEQDKNAGVSQRALTGKDHGYFDVVPEELPADHFWCALLEAAIQRLIKTRHLTAGFATYDWLAQHSSKPAAVRSALLDWLFPSSAKGAFRCAVKGLFGPHPDGVRLGFVLARWLQSMGWVPISPIKGVNLEPPLYRSLRKEPLLPLATLLALWVLARASASELGEHATPLKEFVERLRPIPNEGLRVEAPTAADGDSAKLAPAAVFLVERKSDEQAAARNPGSHANSRTHYAISVPSSSAPRAMNRISTVLASGELRIGRQYRLPAEALLQASLPHGWHSLPALFARQYDPVDERRARRLAKDASGQF